MLERIPLAILPVDELDAYSIPTARGPAVALDRLMATLLPAFTLINWGVSFDDPEDRYAFDPRQLTWLACSIHMRDIRPTLQFPCWSIVFAAIRGKQPAFAPALKMIDLQLTWLLAHEYDHVTEGDLITGSSHAREFTADLIATEATWNMFRPFPHFVLALEDILALFAMLERFEPIDTVHPSAQERAEAIRRQLLGFPDGGFLWRSIIDRARTLASILTSFDPDAARRPWRDASGRDGGWWRV